MAIGSVGVRELTIAQRLDLVPALAGRDRVIEALPGGLTNANFKVTTARHTYVARCFRPSSDLLAIDRTAEHRNSVAAAQTGIAPTVVDFVPAAGVLVIQWVAGRTLQPVDLQQDSLLPRIAAACRQLHSGPQFAADFDMFLIQRHYLNTAQQRGFRLPERYTEFMGQFEQVRQVLGRSPVPNVPCHNDLLAANIIDAGDRLWLVDYEYSGNNDPCFELGNIWSESHLSDEQLELLVTCYFGAPSAALTARARLYGLASQYGWTLWGVIQSAVSELDFDFWSWAMEKYERAAATFESPDLATLLVVAADPDPSRVAAAPVRTGEIPLITTKPSAPSNKGDRP